MFFSQTWRRHVREVVSGAVKTENFRAADGTFESPLLPEFLLETLLPGVMVLGGGALGRRADLG